MNTSINYDEHKNPMDNLLNNINSDSEKLEIHEFARKHGISENESLWNQLLLQIGIVGKYQELLKEAEKSQIKHALDIQATVDFGLRKILETASQKTNESIESVKLESENQAKDFRGETEYYIQEIVNECGNKVYEACKWSIAVAFDGPMQRLSQALTLIEKASDSLKDAGNEARKDMKASLLETGIYCCVGSLIGAVTFYLMIKLIG